MGERSKVPNKPLSWSYFNVLEMLIAAMPPGKYTADIGKWTRVVKDLEDQYRDRYPELFRDIYFIEREPLNPYSSELEEFFQRIALAVHNPDFDIMEITPEKKERIKARATKRLDADHVKIIEKISQDAAKSLKFSGAVA
jgi:hypothetical protein